MSHSTTNQTAQTAAPAAPHPPSPSLRSRIKSHKARPIRHVKLKKRFVTVKLDDLKPGDCLEVIGPVVGRPRVYELRSPQGERVCFASTEVTLPSGSAEAGQFAFDSLVNILRPIIDLGSTMDDADRRRIGYRIAERTIREMRLGDLLDILTDCERLEILKMMR
jgi:hypothetical protein